MYGISSIVNDVQSCKNRKDDLARSAYMEELRAKCSPKRLEELLCKNDSKTAELQKSSRRAHRLLRKAAIAAANGNAARCSHMQQLALDVVNGDERAIAVLIEENALVLVVQPFGQFNAKTPLTCLGLAS